MNIIVKLCEQHQSESDKRIHHCQAKTVDEWEKFFDIEWNRNRKTINQHCLSEVNGLDNTVYKIA